MGEKKTDPTKDPEFQKVVRRFLKTPPKPHAKKDNDKSRVSGKLSGDGRGKNTTPETDSR